MKIGLLTIFNVPNYGAMLQCFSLCRYLQELGHEVFLYNIPLSNIDRVSYKIKKKIKLKFMYDFQKDYLPHITRDLSEKADLYMIGSDQVWNPDITKSNYDKYFLSFIPQNKPKVAYAASFGTSEWTHPEIKDNVSCLLKQFNYISVREKSGINILKRYFNNTGSWVLDPCFLIDNIEQVFNLNKIESAELVSYKLVQDKNWTKNINLLSKKLNCNCFELKSRIVNSINECHGFNEKYFTIKEWLNKLYSAKYVITDSFHGTVFCLLFKKQFVVLNSINQRITRIESILNEFNLSNRLIDNIDSAKTILDNSIDYEVVSPLIERARNISKQELKNMLKV